MMRKLLFAAAVLFPIILFAQTSTAPTAGDGSAGNPYQIATLNNLYWLSQTSSVWGNYFIQTADIDASTSSAWAGGAGFTPIGNSTTSFTGTYDGNGHTISGVSINSTTIDVGFFGSTTGSVIKNLGLVNVNISDQNTAIGGLVGHNGLNSSISGCYSTGSVSGRISVGGLVGDNAGSLTNCYSTCSVTGTGTSPTELGGLVGDCANQSVITNCYSTGSVTGGISNFGGFIGVANSGRISNSFWDKTTSGQSNSGGGTGETTAQMTTESTFTNAGWDFAGETTNGLNDYWNINSSYNSGYPFLSWQAGPTTYINGNAGVAGATISWFNGSAKTTTADASGNYSIVVSYNWTGTVTPSKTDYSFTPSNITYTNLTSGSSGQNYTATLDAPVLANIEGSALSYTEGNPPAIITSAITVSDADNTTQASGTVSITGNFESSEDVLAFTNTSATTYGNITALYNSYTGVLTLASSSATATLAQWQAAFRAVTYQNTSSNPSTATRTISFVVNDGTVNSNIVTRNITITAVNNPPVLANIEGTALSYTEGNAPAAITSAITVSDVDNTTQASGTVSITGNFHSGEDVLGFTNQNGITGSYNSATGVLTLSGTSSIANYQTALRSVTYQNTSSNPSTAARTISFFVNDGTANSDTVARSITVIAVNNPPVLASIEGTALSYTEGNAPAAITSTITVSDVDNTTLASGEVSVTGNFQSSEDVLGFTNQNGITGSYNSVTGVLTLSGTSSIANYQAALRSVTYQNTSSNPSTAARTVSFYVNDGTANGDTVARSIRVIAVNNPPVLANIEGTALSYTEGDAAIAITSIITVSDVDNSNMSSAVVQISSGYENGNDALSYTTVGSIIGTWDASTGKLTLTGSDTKANYQMALRAVKFESTGDTLTSAKTISLYVNDGIANSDTLTRSINTIPVYYPPSPSPVNPANDTSGIQTTIALSWHPENGIGYMYNVQLSTDSMFKKLIIDKSAVIDTFYQAGSLMNGTEYYWRVSSTYLGVNGNWSKVRDFATIIPAPALLSPADSALNESVNVVLAWSKSAGAESYEVQLSGDRSFSKVIKDTSGITDTTYMLSKLNAGTKYYWRVEASDSITSSAYSVERGFTTGIINGVTDGTLQPKVYTLSQNYPNPFNPSTTIKYNLPFNSEVRLTIYNILGEQVKVLVDREQNAGYYRYQWNADNLASGVYIYALDASSTGGQQRYRSVKKLILLK